MHIHIDKQLIGQSPPGVDALILVVFICEGVGRVEKEVRIRR